MPTIIQLRRDTNAGWTTNGSTVLAAGEVGYETDTGNFKVGDGTTQWSSLAYQPPYISGSKTSAATNTLVVNHTSDRVGIGTTTPSQTLDVSGTANVSGNTTVGGTLGVTGDTTLTGDLAVNGGDITTTSATANVVNANATIVNLGQAATTVSIGATSGTATIRNATTAITGDATVGGTLGVTGNTTLTGDIAVNGGDITTSSGTLNVASNLTSAQTVNIATGATVSGATKALNIGTGGASGSTTNVNIGSSVAGTTAIAGAATVGGTLGVTGATTLTGALTASGGINAVTFNGAPSWATDPTLADHLARRAWILGLPRVGQKHQLLSNSVTLTLNPGDLEVGEIRIYDNSGAIRIQGNASKPGLLIGYGSSNVGATSYTNLLFSDSTTSGSVVTSGSGGLQIWNTSLVAVLSSGGSTAAVVIRIA